MQEVLNSWTRLEVLTGDVDSGQSTGQEEAAVEAIDTAENTSQPEDLGNEPEAIQRKDVNPSDPITTVSDTGQDKISGDSAEKEATGESEHKAGEEDEESNKTNAVNDMMEMMAKQNAEPMQPFREHLSDLEMLAKVGKLESFVFVGFFVCANYKWIFS
jgi:hypothetical protein